MTNASKATKDSGKKNVRMTTIPLTEYNRLKKQSEKLYKEKCKDLKENTDGSIPTDELVKKALKIYHDKLENYLLVHSENNILKFTKWYNTLVNIIKTSKTSLDAFNRVIEIYDNCEKAAWWKKMYLSYKISRELNNTIKLNLKDVLANVDEHKAIINDIHYSWESISNSIYEELIKETLLEL